MAVCPLNNGFPPVGAHIKLFLLGGCRPPDPLLFLGGFQPPRPPGGGLAAPRAPLHTERLRLSGSPFFLVPRSWYQDPGTKILVPKKTESLRGGASQKLSRGARGAAGPPPGGLGGWKPPRNSRGSGGRQPPSKNNFMDPEPGFWDQDLVFFVQKI